MSGTTLFRSSSSSGDAWDSLDAAPAVLDALTSPLSAAVPLLILLLADALRESSTDMLMLSEMLLLFSVSDSEAAVDADADLLSLPAALALSLELALWLAVDCSTASDWRPAGVSERLMVTRVLPAAGAAAVVIAPAGVAVAAAVVTAAVVAVTVATAAADADALALALADALWLSAVDTD